MGESTDTAALWHRDNTPCTAEPGYCDVPDHFPKPPGESTDTAALTSRARELLAGVQVSSYNGVHTPRGNASLWAMAACVLVRDMVRALTETERVVAAAESTIAHLRNGWNRDKDRLTAATEALDDLLDWAERAHGGDEKLGPEDFYIARDQARAYAEASR